MRVGIFTDHGGFGQKEELVVQLRAAGPSPVWDLVQTFLAAKFSDAERHLRRLRKVAARDVRRTLP